MELVPYDTNFYLVRFAGENDLLVNGVPCRPDGPSGKPLTTHNDKTRRPVWTGRRVSLSKNIVFR